MPEHRGVSAAEKYAELEKAGASRPRCSCHGKPKVWSKDKRKAGGVWKCCHRFNKSPKGVEAQRRYRESENGRQKLAVLRRQRYLSHREEEISRSLLYMKKHPRIHLFGRVYYAPDPQFREYAVQLREERRRALKEALNG